MKRQAQIERVAERLSSDGVFVLATLITVPFYLWMHYTPGGLIGLVYSVVLVAYTFVEYAQLGFLKWLQMAGQMRGKDGGFRILFRRVLPRILLALTVAYVVRTSLQWSVMWLLDVSMLQCLLGMVIAVLALFFFFVIKQKLNSMRSEYDLEQLLAEED